MNGKLSEQYGLVSDEERVSRRRGVVARKKTASVTHGPQIPLNVMAELQAKQNNAHLGQREGAVLGDGEQNSEPNDNSHFPLASPDLQDPTDKEENEQGLVKAMESESEEDSLEQLPSDFISEGSRFRQMRPLNLEKITLRQLVELKLFLSTKDRKLSIDQLGEKLSFTLTQRRLAEQLQKALTHLARNEVLGDDEAEALLKAYNNECKRFYKKQISEIEAFFLRMVKNEYTDDFVKQVDRNQLEQLLNVNLMRLFSEAQAPSNNSKLVEASSLKECVTLERQFKKDKLAAILSGLKELSLKGNLQAEEKLGEYKTATRCSKEVTRLKSFCDVYQQNHMGKFKLSESLEILGKQVAHPNDHLLRKMIQKYITNKVQCELSSVMRQSFALAIVKKMIDEDKTTTAKKIWFIQGAPQYNAGIKALFDRHKNDKFDEKTIQMLADEVSAFLRDALLHYQAKPSDSRYSRTLRMWGDEIAKNSAIISSLQSLLSLLEKTHPAYVPTENDTDLSSEIDPVVKEFFAVSALQNDSDSNTSVMAPIPDPNVSEIKRRASQHSFDSEVGASEESSIVDDADLTGDFSEESDDDLSKKVGEGNLLDFPPVASAEERVSTQVAYSSPSPTGSE